MNLANILSHYLTLRIFHTIIVFVILAIIMGIIYLAFKRKVESGKQRKKFLSRLVYIAIFFFIIALIQIWVEGFTHLFTVLSIVAAGLVVSNKETIMNLAGWLIINWRGVFSEGDLVQVQNYIGYVQAIRPFYFRLYEANSLEQKQATGRTIKIPNGLVINNPIITFSPDTNLTLTQLCFSISADSDHQQTLLFAEQLIKDLLDKHYDHDKRFAQPFTNKRSKALATLINLTPKVYLKLVNDKTKGFTIYVDYYCYPSDAKIIESEFWQALQQAHQQNKITINI